MYRTVHKDSQRAQTRGVRKNHQETNGDLQRSWRYNLCQRGRHQVSRALLHAKLEEISQINKMCTSVLSVYNIPGLLFPN